MGFGRLGRVRHFSVRMSWQQDTQTMYQPRSSAQGLTTESCIPLPPARVSPTLARENTQCGLPGCSHNPFLTAAFRDSTLHLPYPFPWGVGCPQYDSVTLLSQVP